MEILLKKSDDGPVRFDITKCTKASVVSLELWCQFLRLMVQVLLSGAAILRQCTAIMQGEILSKRRQLERQVDHNAAGKQDYQKLKRQNKKHLSSSTIRRADKRKFTSNKTTPF